MYPPPNHVTLQINLDGCGIKINHRVHFCTNRQDCFSVTVAVQSVTGNSFVSRLEADLKLH